MLSEKGPLNVCVCVCVFYSDVVYEMDLFDTVSHAAFDKLLYLDTSVVSVCFEFCKIRMGLLQLIPQDL